MIPHEARLHIGSLLFEGIDQIDLTGPFEVLSRIPNSTYRIYGKTAAPVRDLKGLRLTPDAALADAPPLDVLHIPGAGNPNHLRALAGWTKGGPPMPPTPRKPFILHEVEQCGRGWCDRCRRHGRRADLASITTC
jgi:hypothetical protein